VIDRLARAHPGKEIVIVSHGGVMLSLWAHVTGSWEDAVVPGNCQIIVIEHAGGRYDRPKVVGD
jgi:broad specificity phosphatase PhoE